MVRSFIVGRAEPPSTSESLSDDQIRQSIILSAGKMDALELPIRGKTYFQGSGTFQSAFWERLRKLGSICIGDEKDHSYLNIKNKFANYEK